MPLEKDVTIDYFPITSEKSLKNYKLSFLLSHFGVVISLGYNLRSKQLLKITLRL